MLDQVYARWVLSTALMSIAKDLVEAVASYSVLRLTEVWQASNCLNRINCVTSSKEMSKRWCNQSFLFEK